jgi:hypothetical protein
MAEVHPVATLALPLLGSLKTGIILRSLASGKESFTGKFGRKKCLKP